MLAGLLLSATASFAYLHHREVVSLPLSRNAEKKRAAECITKATANQASSLASARALYSVTSRADAKTMSEAELLAAEKKALESVPPNPTLPIGFFVPPDECADRSASLVPESNWVLAFTPIIWLYGFLGGFGVWLFYRLVRFAVKG
jgi:hypothetical protein